MNNLVSNFKDRLNQALSIRNIKPVELSEITSISKSTISHYMSGYTKPKSDKLYVLAKALDVTETWLMGYDEPMERSSIIIGHELQHLLFQISMELRIPYDDLLHVFLSQSKIAATGIQLNKENLLDFFIDHYNISKEKYDTMQKQDDNEDDIPEEIKIISRAAKNMTPEKRQKLLNMAKVMFEEDFPEDV